MIDMNYGRIFIVALSVLLGVTVIVLLVVLLPRMLRAKDPAIGKPTGFISHEEEEARRRRPAPAPAPAPTPIQKPTVRRCQNCGEPAEEGDMFCLKCGSKL